MNVWMLVGVWLGAMLLITLFTMFWLSQREPTIEEAARAAAREFNALHHQIVITITPSLDQLTSAIQHLIDTLDGPWDD